jgi:hypothetical protein
MKTSLHLAGLLLVFSAGPLQAQSDRLWLDLAEAPKVAAKAPGFSHDVNLCWLRAHSRDTDPKGTNIRARPERKSRIIGKIPEERAEAGTKIGPEFQIIGSKDGWFLIHNAYWAGYDSGASKILFSNSGWIAASLIGLTSEDSSLRAQPLSDAPVLMSLSSESSESVLKIEKIYACSGSFIDAAIIAPNGKKARGWLSSICGNQVTTCGGGGRLIEERAGRLVEPEDQDDDS